MKCWYCGNENLVRRILSSSKLSYKCEKCGYYFKAIITEEYPLKK